VTFELVGDDFFDVSWFDCVYSSGSDCFLSVYKFVTKAGQCPEERPLPSEILTQLLFVCWTTRLYHLQKELQYSLVPRMSTGFKKQIQTLRPFCRPFSWQLASLS
jgi:hypothetical protein